MNEESRRRVFPDAGEDVRHTREIPDTPQTRAPAYRLAFADQDFLYRDELRPVRLQLELLKPELMLAEHGVESTIVMFGGARIPSPVMKHTARTQTLADLSGYYEVAREFARLMTEKSLATGGRENVICTGGGPGVMEAGNLGAAEAGGCSIGLNIVLPHYFGIRKMHFLLRANAVAVFPGGFGTLDETFEALTLIQTDRMKRLPFLLFGEAFWRRIIDWDALAEAGTISPEDLDLFRFVDTAEEAVRLIENWPR